MNSFLGSLFFLLTCASVAAESFTGARLNRTRHQTFSLFEGLNIYFVQQDEGTPDDVCLQELHGRPLWKPIRLPFEELAHETAKAYRNLRGDKFPEDAILVTALIYDSANDWFVFHDRHGHKFNRNYWADFYQRKPVSIARKNVPLRMKNAVPTGGLVVDVKKNHLVEMDLAQISKNRKMYACLTPAAQPPMYCPVDPKGEDIWELDLQTEFCFVLTSSGYPWLLSHTYCESISASLASIPDEAHYAVVRSIGDRIENIFIGARLDYKAAVKLQDSEKTPENLKRFTYNVDGTPTILWSHLGPGQPDGINGESENCFTYESKLTLHDYPCMRKFRALCKYRPSIYPVEQRIKQLPGVNARSE